MSLFNLIWRWIFPAHPPGAADQTPAVVATTSAPAHNEPRTRRPRRRRVRLVPLRFQSPPPRGRRDLNADAVPKPPYTFARPSVFGGYLDLSRDQSDERLQKFKLPVLRTPQELAAWLKLPLGTLAWLVHRFDEKSRPRDVQAAHYHYVWLRKRAGGQRLIEIPKPMLKGAQHQILREILDHVPAHPAAHGFVAGHGIRSNAVPHVGQRVVVKFDLENFYPTVSFSRVVALFRSLGYCREVAIWLGRLTTSALPEEYGGWQSKHPEFAPYQTRHLPQGAPTSPALANLSAFVLDLRLAGLARSFRANYTRYADDLTFSGDERFLDSLAVFLPLVTKIVRSERFRVNLAKRRVIRNNQRQEVAGVVVNARPSIRRDEYDRLKATLVNCIRRGPATQNHDRHANFAEHLRGKIAHVSHLHPARGEKLRALFVQIDWAG